MILTVEMLHSIGANNAILQGPERRGRTASNHQGTIFQILQVDDFLSGQSSLTDVALTGDSLCNL